MRQTSGLTGEGCVTRWWASPHHPVRPAPPATPGTLLPPGRSSHPEFHLLPVLLQSPAGELYTAKRLTTY